MSKMRMVDIDVDKFQKWISDNGYTYKEIDDSIGAIKMCQNVMARKKMSAMAYKTLSIVYKLPEDAFIKVEEPIEKEVTVHTDETTELILTFMKEQQEINKSMMQMMDNICSTLNKLCDVWK